MMHSVDLFLDIEPKGSQESRKLQGLGLRKRCVIKLQTMEVLWREK